MKNIGRFRRRRGGRGRRAGRIAKRVARKSFRAAVRIPKRKLAKMYATKCGQSAWRATKKKRFGGRRFRRRY